MTGIFAAFGIGVSVAIIAAGGGFTPGARPPWDPPGKEDIWVVGSNIQDGTVLQYSLDSNGPSSSLVSSTVKLSFAEVGDDWNITFTITNGTSQEINKTVVMSKQLTREGMLDKEFIPFFEPIQVSILAVRDMDYGGRDKYLVVGASWDTIFVGSSSTTVRIIAEEKVDTKAGAFESFVLGYELDDKVSKVWMVKSMPLPVKAETYDSEDQPQYSFELLQSSGTGSG